MNRARPLTNRLLVWAVSLLSVGGVGLYLWSQSDRLIPLIDVPVSQAVVVGILVTIGIMLNALEFWLLYRRLGARLGLIENWLLFSAGQLLNHVPGQIGTVYRFQYLKSVHHLSYTRSASGYGANLVLTVLSTGLLGLASTLMIGATTGAWSPLLAGGFLALLILSIAAFLFEIPTTSGDGLLARFLRGLHSGWSEIKSHSRTGLLIVVIEMLKYLILAARMQLSLGWMGVDESYVFFLPLAVMTGLVNFVAFTPAGLGIRELAIGFTAASLGIQFDVALMGATLDRAVTSLWVAFIGGAGLLYTSRTMALIKAEADPSVD